MLRAWQRRWESARTPGPCTKPVLSALTLMLIRQDCFGTAGVEREAGPVQDPILFIVPVAFRV